MARSVVLGSAAARMPGRCRGIAIVAVMWMVAALALVASAIAATARGDLHGAQNVRQSVTHAAGGDAAIRLATADLLRLPAPPEQAFGWEGEFDGEHYWVEALPASAFINLNTATPELLHDLFMYGAGLASDEAQVLAERIADWRDPDDAATPNGAEAAQYEAAGSPFRPRGGPFETVDDLLQVLGVGFDVHDKIRGFVTVQGSSQGVDARFAPRGVLEILAAGNSAMVGRILAARDSGDPLTDFTGLTQIHLVTSQEHLFRVEALRIAGQLRLSRVRWIDIGASDHAGVPWRELGAEPVTTALHAGVGDS